MIYKTYLNQSVLQIVYIVFKNGKSCLNGQFEKKLLAMEAIEILHKKEVVVASD